MKRNLVWKSDLKPTKCDRKTWTDFVSSRWWYCWLGFPGQKALKGNVIFLISSTALQACFPSVLVYNNEIKLFKQTPYKNSFTSFRPSYQSEDFKKLSQLKAKKATRKKLQVSENKRSSFQEKLWIPLGASLPTQAVFSASINCTWKVIKILSWQTTIWSQQKITDSKEMERRKGSLHFKCRQKAWANFFSMLLSFSAYSSIWLYND